MRIRFSQRWAREKYESRIRGLIRFVKGTRKCVGLLVRIFFYVDNEPLKRIHYDLRTIEDEKVENIIMLNLQESNNFDEEFIKLFAHAFKHYLDYKKLMKKGAEYVANVYWKWEIRANAFARERVERWRLLEERTKISWVGRIS